MLLCMGWSFLKLHGDTLCTVAVSTATGKRSINDEYSWLGFAYHFLFSGFLIWGDLAMGYPSSAGICSLVLTRTWGCFKITPVTSLFCFVYYII